VPDAYRPEVMKVGVIGYRNHAATLIDLCLTNLNVENVSIFHPDPEKLEAIKDRWGGEKCAATSDLESLHGLDAVMIAAPGKYHAEYIKKLVDHVPALFCEKPPVINLTEIDELNLLTERQRRKIYFNFHMSQSDLFRIVQNKIQDQSIGKFIYSSMIITHGIAHKAAMKSNWRFTSSDVFDSIIGNLGVHYINLYERWFGDIEITNVNSGSYGLHDSVDTVSLDIMTGTGLPSRIVLSYAAPYINERTFVFSDGYISQKEDGIYQHSPRDSFDEQGKFISPGQKRLVEFDNLFDQNTAALRSSVDHFLNAALNKEGNPESEFRGGLETVRKILQMNGI
jgi:predicted dehydrogenase